MGFNRQKMSADCKAVADAAVKERRATERQVREDAECLVVRWNERQAKRMPLLYSPTIGAALAAQHWYLWVRCPACRMTTSVALRTIDRHHNATVTSLIPSPSFRSCRPNAPFAGLLKLSRSSVPDDVRVVRGHATRGA